MKILKYFLALLASFCFNSASAAGWVDGASLVGSNFRVWGWGCYNLNPAAQIEITFYRDDGVYLGGTPANISREPAVGNRCGGGHSAHGFNAKLVVPEKLLDWKKHQVYVYVTYGIILERLDPLFTLSFDGQINVSLPKNPGDIVGRDYFGAYVGHLGIWNGSQVVQMTGEKLGGANPTISMESIEQFNIQSRPWGAVNAKFPPNLSVKRCYLRSCTSNNDRMNLFGGMAIAARAYQIMLIGADYTAFGGYIPAREGSSRLGDVWPPIRGMYRCDSFVQNSYGVLLSGQQSEDLWAREVFNKPANYDNKIYELLRARLPSTVFESARLLFAN